MSDVSRKSLDALTVGVKKLHATSRLNSADDAVLLVGSPGTFHYLQYIALCLQFSSLAMSDLIPIFYNLSPQNIVCANSSSSVDEDGALLHVHGKEVDIHNRTAGFCHCNRPLTYIYKDNQTSLIGDMDLICEKAPLSSLATTIYYIGSAVAGPLVGWFSDKHGRRPVLLFSCLTFAAINTGLIFVQNYILFAALRFLAGISRVGIFSTTFVLLMDWTPPTRRTVVAASSEFFFPLGVMSLAVCAYYLQQWRQLQMALAISNAIFILNIWFAPESIQWLLANGRLREALLTIRSTARFNNRPLYREDLKAVETFTAELAVGHLTKQRPSVLDCFRDPLIRKYTCLISVVWFSTNFSYAGLSYLLDILSDKVQVDLAIGGALELIPCALATIVALRYGKKYPIVGFLLLAGVLAIAAGVVPPTMRLRIYLALSARMSLVGSLALMFLYAAELFPTSMCSSGFGVGFVFFMAGGMLSPQLTLLTSYFAFPGLPVVIVGTVCLLGVMSVLALPDKHDMLYERLD